MSISNKVLHGLPEKVFFCKKCVMSNQRPNSVVEFKNTGKSIKPTIYFSEDHICSACKYKEINDKKVVLIANDIGDELYFSSRNVKNVSLIPGKSASTYDLLDCNIILADVESIKTLNKDLS